jgi:hypothetical protein
MLEHAAVIDTTSIPLVCVGFGLLTTCVKISMRAVLGTD